MLGRGWDSSLRVGWLGLLDSKLGASAHQPAWTPAPPAAGQIWLFFLLMNLGKTMLLGAHGAVF